MPLHTNYYIYNNSYVKAFLYSVVDVFWQLQCTAEQEKPMHFEHLEKYIYFNHMIIKIILLNKNIFDTLEVEVNKAYIAESI